MDKFLKLQVSDALQRMLDGENNAEEIEKLAMGMSKCCRGFASGNAFFIRF
jgi:hypothetical protein